MNDVGFRMAKESDETILEEMLFHALYVPPGAEPFPRSVLSDPRLRAYTERWGRPGDEGLIAFDVANGHPLGASWTRLFSARSPGYGFIDEGTPELSIAVIPAVVAAESEVNCCAGSLVAWTRRIPRYP
jgi:hypothetical protein